VGTPTFFGQTCVTGAEGGDAQMTRPMVHPMLEALCRERYGRLVALATMLLGSRDGAEDLVQEALISVFSKHRTFPSVAAAEGYVRAAITSRFLDAARKSSKEKDSWRRHAMREPSVVPAPEPQSLALEDLLGQLAPRVRACIALRFLDDLSIAQTASALGLSDGAVKRYVSDGLAALNAVMGTAASVDDVVGARIDVRRSGRA